MGKMKWIVIVLVMVIMVTGYGGLCKKDKKDIGSSALPPVVTTAQDTASLISAGDTAKAVETNFQYTSDTQKQTIIDSINALSTKGKTEFINALSNAQIVFDGENYCEIEYQSADPDYGIITIIMRKAGDKWLISGF
ncbi:MAG: hypothetical protein HY762_00380 [Planctomycetes bacterium]|nr:hypothetical protein [Planctomycetota bacterium]